MNVKNVSGNTQVNAAVTPENAAPAQQSQAAAPAPMQAGEVSKVANKAVGNVETARGFLSLTSPRAQKAVQKSLDHLASKGMDPKEFKPHSVEIDGLGMAHVRLDRFQEGVRVFGDQIVTHFAAGKENAVASMTADVQPLPFGLARTGKMSDDQALKLAEDAFAAELHRPAEMERVIFKTADGSYTSGFWVKLVNLDAPNPRAMNYLIDAETKGIVESWNQIGGIISKEALERAQNATPKKGDGKAEPAPNGAADDKTLYSGMVQIYAKQKGAEYVLQDDSRGKGVETKDARNQSRAYSTVDVKDDNNVWGEATDNDRQVSAVDAQYGAQMTYDTLKNVLGYDSIDLKGFKLISNAHIGHNYVNAFWDGRQMNYGDGDGRTANPLTTLDIAGHEITHGLTEHTAGLIYSGESGGLNEAMSDVGGFLVEWYASQHNPAIKWDWTMGEDCWTPNNGDPTDGLRYMNDPTSDGYSVDHYSKYPEQTEVHGSSGIANNAFYQLAEENLDGKKNVNSVSKERIEQGIGVEKAAKIFMRALTTYMTPRTTFAAARAACIKAATDLYGAGSVEVAKTKQAWSIVGVEDKAAEV